ncbi:retrovirus-related pol polyprotein from transposon TNT 1-94, partial [Tanacetum coccineum]
DISHAIGRVDVGLVFEHGSSQWVAGYCDSDYAGDLDKRRSTTGYVFTLAKAPISWKSTLQSTTALSTTKAKYMAMTEAVKETIWLQGLLGELGISQKFVTMHSDSQSVIHLAKNQVYHARTKHIDVRYHFIREILDKGEVRIQKIHTSKNPVDILTKVVAGIKFNYCLDLINVVKRSLPEEFELLETTLLNGKDDVSLSEVCTALYSKELRRKDRQISSSGDCKVLLVRGKAIAEANVTKCNDEELDLSLSNMSSCMLRRYGYSGSHVAIIYSKSESGLNEDGIIVTLKGVCYSPKLKQNLISVGTLESKGFEVRAKDGVMKIIYCCELWHNALRDMQEKILEFAP